MDRKERQHTITSAISVAKWLILTETRVLLRVTEDKIFCVLKFGGAYSIKKGDFPRPWGFVESKIPHLFFINILSTKLAFTILQPTTSDYKIQQVKVADFQSNKPFSLTKLYRTTSYNRCRLYLITRRPQVRVLPPQP